MSRVRTKVARNLTDDRDWARRRDDVMGASRGDDLLECREFWAREPGVTPSLRDDPLRWRHLLAPAATAADIVAKRRAMLAKRRAWLERHNIR